MAVQYSTDVLNAQLDATEATIGTSPTLEIRSGAKPANCAAADTGTVLATMTLPSDWMAAASSGSKSLLGTWQDLLADAAGMAGHYRIKNGGACKMQGSVTIVGGGGDITLINDNIALNQPIIINSFTMNALGA